MRMALTVRIPNDAANEAIKNGTLPKTMETAMAALQPEAAYFTIDEGYRSAFLYFEMQESSQMPPLLESFFLDLDAQVKIQPVMNAEELRKGLGDLMSGT